MPVPYLSGDVVGLSVRCQQQDRIALLESQAVCLDGFVRRCDYAQIRLIQLQPICSDGQRAFGLHCADRHAHGAVVIVFLYTFCKLRNDFIIRKGSSLLPWKKYRDTEPLRRRAVNVEGKHTLEDAVCRSHNEAASWVMGYCCSGRTLWKNQDGVSIEDVGQDECDEA